MRGTNLEGTTKFEKVIAPHRPNGISKKEPI